MTERILLSHGGGGRLSRKLIQEEVVSRFGEGALQGLPDAASLSISGSELLFSTDAFVVQPLVFPGGTIGDLAVHGTVNDIAVAGGRPLFLSLAMILEEGLPIDVLRHVLDRVKRAASDCEVQVVTGDTKVVGKGQCDGLYLATAGIGSRIAALHLSPSRIREGDVVIVSGSLGEHGMAVMMQREQLKFTNGPISDTGPVHRLVYALEPFGSEVRFMRDPTRGGLAAVLHEAIDGTSFDVVLSQAGIPFSRSSLAVAEMLGLDLLHVASEGRAVLFCSPEAAPAVLCSWRELSEGKNAAVIGEVRTGSGRVIMETVAGGRRLVDLPEGELLPRIC